MLIRLLVLGFIVFGTINSYASTPKERQFEVLLQTHVPGDPYRVVSTGYLIYYPEDYEQETDKAFPVVLFLHGAGENGTSPSLLKSKGGFLPGLVERDWNFPFIIVSPLARWSMDSLSQAPYLEEIMSHVRANNRIDTTREYVAGLSQGGKGARLYAERHADTIAGLVSAAGYAGGANIDGLAQSNIPVILSHNKDDGTISYKSSQGYYNRLINAGATNVVYDLQDTGGHNAWTRVFKNMQQWDWLLSFSNQGTGISISTASASPNVITSDVTSIQINANVIDESGELIGIQSVVADVSEVSGVANDLIETVALGDNSYQLNYDLFSTLNSGTYTINIIATDLDGNTKSKQITIEAVLPVNALPSATIVSPSTGDRFVEGQDVVVAVDAFDSDGDIQQVSLYVNDELSAVSDTQPYEFTIDDLSYGVNQLHAVAEDNQGAQTVSARITLIVDPLNPLPAGTERLITVAGAGKVTNGGYFPLEMAFDDQPSYVDDSTPELVAGGSSAPYYSSRFGYIDFGENWFNVRITKTWTLYRPWSGGQQTPYQSVWWDDDSDAVNDDGVVESQLNFNSATNLVAHGDRQWALDGNFIQNPIAPKARYLILQAPEAMSNRALEYAIIGWEVDEQIPPPPPPAADLTLIQPFAAGKAEGSGYFPMQHAFDDTPEYSDGILSNAVSGNNAPYYSGRVGYIDLGDNWANISIVETHTLYRPWSGGDHTPYAEVWWDDDIDSINDGILETSINFNSGQNLANKNDTQWIRDFDGGDTPIQAKGRYMLFRAPDNMSRRALEYAIIGTEQ